MRFFSSVGSNFLIFNVGWGMLGSIFYKTPSRATLLFYYEKKFEI